MGLNTTLAKRFLYAYEEDLFDHDSLQQVAAEFNIHKDSPRWVAYRFQDGSILWIDDNTQEAYINRSVFEAQRGHQWDEIQ